MAGTSVLRGEIRVCNLARRGGRRWKDRPVLVIQDDRGNLYSPETIVAAIRDAAGKRPLPVFVRVPGGTGGLAKESIVDAGHIQTVPREALGPRLGALPPDAMAAVDLAIRISLGI